MAVIAQQRAPVAEPASTALGDYRRMSFRAMGTENEIIYAAASNERARIFEAAVLEWITGFESTFSKFREDSLISKINREAGRTAVETTADADELFALYDWFHWQTGGLLDPTTGPLMDLWDYHRESPAPPNEKDIQSVLPLVGWRQVQREKGSVFLPKAGMRLDVGGLGKEYAVDRVIKLAKDHGIENIAASLGRDIRVYGQPPEGGRWKIGLEQPGAPDGCWGGAALSSGALCCSGDYRRFFEHGGQRYSHLLDPRTGRPAQSGCRAVWVIAPSCVEAGALATAAFVAGADRGAEMVEQSSLAAACFWTDSGLVQTRRFHEYLIGA